MPLLARDHRPVAAQQGMVGGDQPGYHGLTQPRAGVDHGLVAGPGDRVRGEHHAGQLGGHHSLYHHRHRYRGRVHAEPGPVGDGPLGEQRSPAVANRSHHGLIPLNAEEGVLLAGEGGPGQVLGGGAGTDRDRATPQFGIAGQQLATDRLGHRQRSYLILGRVRQLDGGLAVGLGGDDYAGGNRETGTDQLAQVGALAAGLGQITGGEFGQGYAPSHAPKRTK